MKNAIFIAATGQNVGKTTLCLGIIAALKKRFSKVGFIKPVGQQHVKLLENLNVDKDAILFKKHFQIPTSYDLMSPVIFPSGFTKAFIDGKIHLNPLENKISQSFQSIYEAHDYTIVEGTGHVGVGSIVHLNNAKVASMLGLEIIIVANGGLGSTYDEIALNKSMCDKYGVPIKGIILNKVIPEKQAMVKHYISKSLKEWKIPLIGSIPYNSFLNTPALRDFEILFETTLIAGQKYRYVHFQNHRLVAESVHVYRKDIKANELIITPACREDIILATLEEYEKNPRKDLNSIQALILTGSLPPYPNIIQKLKYQDFPCLYVPLCSYDAMKRITSFTAKILFEDESKVKKAIELVEDSVDFDLILS